ncbi:hypothetical protein, partial [Liquorilactobacillus vini]|uniref:hypothetical protein n=1 Tax=Liquorilactobacillus vini TaxID=238015 RepID=UPI001F2F0154
MLDIEKLDRNFPQLLLAKMGKVYAEGTVSEVASQLNIKRNSVSVDTFKTSKSLRIHINEI